VIIINFTIKDNTNVEYFIITNLIMVGL
jgi:hypothetical protein